MGPERHPKVLPFPCQGGTRRNSEYPDLTSPPEAMHSVTHGYLEQVWGTACPGHVLGVVCVMVDIRRAVVEGTGP